MDGTQNLDTFAFVSATLKTCAISCSKIAIKTGESVRDVLMQKDIMSEEEIERLLDPETMV